MSLAPVLIVDDDEDDRLLIKERFENSDVKNVMEFPDGISLFNFLRNNPENLPRLIISDYNMPRMSGLELLRKIKSHSQFNTIPIIIFSTSNSSEYKNACLQSGATAYYVKPARMAELAEITKQMILKVASQLPGR